MSRHRGTWFEKVFKNNGRNWIMDDIYNDRGHYIGPKDVLEDGARWYDDQDQNRGDLRCLECMYKCDQRNPRLFVDKENHNKCLSVQRRLPSMGRNTQEVVTITCMHYPTHKRKKEVESSEHVLCFAFKLVSASGLSCQNHFSGNRKSCTWFSACQVL